MTDPQPESRECGRPRYEALSLAALFAAIYFIQGVCEPTEGLIAQPVRSLLRGWGRNAEEVARFGFWLALPWSLKPLYGLLIDVVPLAGSYRRSYLLLANGVTAGALLLLYAVPPTRDLTLLRLGIWLVLPTVGVAFADVVVDALMVEKGQPRGLTGQLQSVQWASMYAATVIVGYWGGYLSHIKRQDVGFLVGGSFSLLALLLTVFFVRESPRTGAEGTRPRASWRAAARVLVTTCTNRAVLASAAFLLLWNYNPFQGALYFHMTEHLGFSEQFYGHTIAMQAYGAIAASIAYGLYCRRVPFRVLMHLSIFAGILATIAYWRLENEQQAQWISLSVGFTYMTAWMIQLDLAARVTTPATAGTTFALLMALSNLSYSSGVGLGGKLYTAWSKRVGAELAFELLVALGVALTYGCWLLVPWLARAGAMADRPADPTTP